MITVEFSMTIAIVGVGFFLVLKMVKLIKRNAMIDFISFILVGVMTFVERPASTLAMISHRNRPLAYIELG